MKQHALGMRKRAISEGRLEAYNNEDDDDEIVVGSSIVSYQHSINEDCKLNDKLR